MKKSLKTISILACALTLAACGSEPESDAEPREIVRPEVELTFAELTGDPVAGEQQFVRCATCHSLNAGDRKLGPPLNGIVGREAGSVPGFRYSEANKRADFVWTEERLFDYLESPREYMPGTIMAFAGLADEQQRADLIAYLAEQGS